MWPVRWWTGHTGINRELRRQSPLEALDLRRVDVFVHLQHRRHDLLRCAPLARSRSGSGWARATIDRATGYVDGSITGWLCETAGCLGGTLQWDRRVWGRTPPPRLRARRRASRRVLQPTLSQAAAFEEVLGSNSVRSLYNRPSHSRWAGGRSTEAPNGRRTLVDCPDRIGPIRFPLQVELEAAFGEDRIDLVCPGIVPERVGGKPRPPRREHAGLTSDVAEHLEQGGEHGIGGDQEADLAAGVISLLSCPEIIRAVTR